MLSNQLHILVKTGRSSSRCNHYLFQLECLLQLSLLPDPELVFPKLLKNSGYGKLYPLLNLLIQINKTIIQLFC